MPPQDPVHAFTPKIKVVFEAYLNNVNKSEKSLMNATKLAQYLYIFVNPEQKIVKKDKVEKARLHVEKRQVIEEFCVDS